MRALAAQWPVPPGSATALAGRMVEAATGSAQTSWRAQHRAYALTCSIEEMARRVDAAALNP